MNPIIKVDNITKRYKLGVINRSTFGDELKYRCLKLRGKNPAEHMGTLNDSQTGASGDFWALKGVSFEMNQGQVVGLIGGNGAGKSTLLKILTRITEPTGGRAVIHGRVGSLLEVGTGFHPELTGRENIYMNGTILGMRHREIAAKFDEIVDFSGVEKFLDTPVKRYSSGMYVRLAFAVAAHLDTEILLVDEVLAVGDVEFQKKCLGKMGEVARHGRTVLFVSHNMAAVKMLCGSCIMFANGLICATGTPDEVIKQYVEVSIDEAATGSLAERKDRNGRGNVRLDDVNIMFDESSEMWVARIKYHSDTSSIRNCSIVLDIGRSSVSGAVLSLDSRCIPGLSGEWSGTGAVEIQMSPDIRFGKGRYVCGIAFLVGDEIEDQISNACFFEVGDEFPFDWTRNPPNTSLFSIRHKWIFSQTK